MEARSLLAEALEGQIVALARSTLQGLITDSQRQAAELVRSLDPIAEQASAAWKEASAKAANHVALIMDANPGKSVEQILKMPDVQQVLRTPFTDAAGKTRTLIEKAWDTGATKGTAFANRDLKKAGLDPVTGVDVDTATRTRLLADAKTNGLEARDRLIAAIGSNDPAAVRKSLLAVGDSHATRARSGVDVAGKHAAQAAKEEAYDKAAREQNVGVFKVWVTSFSKNTCATCAALHGTKRKLGEGFPADAGPGRSPRVYGAALNHPPRHPNCRCRLVMYLDRFESEDGPTLKSMRGVVAKFLRSIAKLTPQTERGLELVRLASGVIRVRPYVRRREGQFEFVTGYEREGGFSPSVMAPERPSVTLPKMTIGTLHAEDQETVRSTLTRLMGRYPTAATQVKSVAATKLKTRWGSFSADGKLKLTNIGMKIDEKYRDPDLEGTVAHEFGHVVLQDLAGGYPFTEAQNQILEFKRKRARGNADLIRSVNAEIREVNAQLRALDARVAEFAREIRVRVRAAFDDDAERFREAVYAEFTGNPSYVFINPQELVAQAFAHSELGRPGPISDIVGEWVREKYAERGSS